MANVLVVDDERGMRTTLQRFLQNDGHETQTAEDAVQALKLMDETVFDVVVSDIILPKISGVQLLQMIRERGENVKVLLITGEPTTGTAVEAVRAGAFDYLAKPVSGRDICRVVNAASKIKQLEDQNENYQKHLEKLVEERTQQIRRYSERLTHIAMDTKLFGISKTVDHLAERVMTLLSENVGTKGGGLFLKEGNCLRLVYAIDAGHQKNVIPYPPPAQTILHHVCEEGKTLIYDDIDQLEDVCPSGWSGYRNGSAMAIPLVDSRKDFCGVVTLHNKIDPPFTAQDAELGDIIISHSIEAIKVIKLNHSLKISEDKYRKISDESLTGIFIQKDSKVVYVNPRLGYMLECAPEEIPSLIGTSFLDFIYESDRALVEKRSRERLAGLAVPANYEIRMRSRSGRKIWCELLASVIEHEGQPAIMGHLIDITDRKETEDALIRSKERYRSLIENAPLGIISADFNGNILSINPALLQILGSPSREAASQINMLTFPNLVESGVSADIRKCLDTGLSFVSEHGYRSKWGKESCLRYHIRAQHDSVGNISGVLAMVEDISDAVAAEEERKKLTAQLQQAQKMEAIGRLAGGIAHDFNNLLTGITGNVSLAMLDLATEDPMQEALDEIQEAASNAAGLTRQLLAFSRKQIMEMKSVNLNDLVQNLFRMMQRLIGEHIEIRMELVDDIPSIKADPVQIEQIIINLAVNARDAMPEGGKLLFKTEVETIVDSSESEDERNQLTPGCYVVFSVTDTGCGIDLNLQPHIFEPFFTTKEKGEGTGLGLSTVYGIVKQHNGAVRLKSDLGEGSSFRIYIPATEGKTEHKASANKPENMPHGNETILMVEDERVVRDMTQKLLTRMGYDVHSASNGLDALALIKKNSHVFDLLLTDVVMPEMNGRELAEKARELIPDVKVIFTSGYTDDMILQHKVFEESVDFIGKPYSPLEMTRKIRSVLDRK